MAKELPDISSEYQYGFHDKDVSVFRAKRGLTREVVEEISRMKDEPQWMLDFRLKSLEQFYKMPLPSSQNSRWFSLLPGKLDDLDFDDITYYVKPSERQGRSWDEVPEEIKADL